MPSGVPIVLILKQSREVFVATKNPTRLGLNPSYVRDWRWTDSATRVIYRTLLQGQ